MRATIVLLAMFVLTHDAHADRRSDAFAVVHTWVTAMRDGDIDAATALAASPLVQSGLCDKDPRRAFTCLRQDKHGAFRKPRWRIDRDLAIRSITPTQVKRIRFHRAAEAGIAELADHELVAISITVRTSSRSKAVYGYVFAINASNQITAITPTLIALHN